MLLNLFFLLRVCKMLLNAFESFEWNYINHDISLVLLCNPFLGLKLLGPEILIDRQKILLSLLLDFFRRVAVCKIITWYVKFLHQISVFCALF